MSGGTALRSSDPPAWQANTRAIALALEALRAVDRYGVTRRGEQYVGWQALPARAGEAMTRAEAAALLAADVAYTPERLLVDPAAVRIAYQAAALKHHPDRGGDHDLMTKINSARDILLEADGP